MALAATAVWEVRTTGADTNGGAFNAARDAVNGVDYSQQDAAQLSLTDLACVSGTTTLTSATGGFTHAMEGNHVYIASGTNAAAGFYEIVTYTNTNTVTIDRTCASGGDMSAGVGKVGGALATPGKAMGGTVEGNTVYLASGTYTLSGTTVNTAGGHLALGTNITKSLIGYKAGAARTDRTETPLIDAGAQTSITLIAMDGSVNKPQLCLNVAVDGNSNASVIGFSCDAASYGRAVRCTATACTTGFSEVGALDCKAVSCSTVGFTAEATCSVALACTTGFSGTNSRFRQCIARGGTTGFGNMGFGLAEYCTAYGCSSAGFSASYHLSCYHCLAVNCGTYGFETDTISFLFRCAGYNNTSGNVQPTPRTNESFVTLSADPFVDGASDDFRPNSTAGGGAALKAAGWGVFGQTNNDDIGAVQHADPAGGGSSPRFGDRTGGLR